MSTENLAIQTPLNIAVENKTLAQKIQLVKDFKNGEAYANDLIKLQSSLQRKIEEYR